MRMESSNVVIDGNGIPVQVPYPQLYYDLIRDVQKMQQDRAAAVSKLDAMKRQADALQRNRPKPEDERTAANHRSRGNAVAYCTDYGANALISGSHKSRELTGMDRMQRMKDETHQTEGSACTSNSDPVRPVHPR